MFLSVPPQFIRAKPNHSNFQLSHCTLCCEFDVTAGVNDGMLSLGFLKRRNVMSMFHLENYKGICNMQKTGHVVLKIPICSHLVAYYTIQLPSLLSLMQEYAYFPHYHKKIKNMNFGPLFGVRHVTMVCDVGRVVYSSCHHII